MTNIPFTNKYWDSCGECNCLKSPNRLKLIMMNTLPSPYADLKKHARSTARFQHMVKSLRLGSHYFSSSSHPPVIPFPSFPRWMTSSAPWCVPSRPPRCFGYGWPPSAWTTGRLASEGGNMGISPYEKWENWGLRHQEMGDMVIYPWERGIWPQGNKWQLKSETVQKWWKRLIEACFKKVTALVSGNLW